MSTSSKTFEYSNLAEYRAFHEKKAREYSGWCGGSGVPAFRSPSYGTTYIKIIAYSNAHPASTKKEILAQFGGSNFDTLKCLVNFGFIDQTGKRGRSFIYSISNLGKELLSEAEFSKDAYDFFSFIEKEKPASVEGLSISLMLNNLQRFTTKEFYEYLKKTTEKDSKLSRMFKACSFLNDAQNVETLFSA